MIVISDNSALSFWRWWSAIRPLYLKPTKTRISELAKRSHSAKEVIATLNEFDIPEPYEVLVHDSILY